MVPTPTDQRCAEFTCSVPFERFPELKRFIQDRQRWRRIDAQTSYFEMQWKPKSWDTEYRFIFYRTLRNKQIKGPLQLDLFEPRDTEYEYKVVLAKKPQSAATVLAFHNGRGNQERIFGEAKQHAGLDMIPARRQASNRMFTLASMLAHNLSRELQMATREPDRTMQPNRAPLWSFSSLGTMQRLLLRRAGVLTQPQGELTLTVNANKVVEAELTGYLDALTQDE